MSETPAPSSFPALSEEPVPTALSEEERKLVAEIRAFESIVRGGGGGYESDIIKRQSAHIDWLLARLTSGGSDDRAGVEDA